MTRSIRTGVVTRCGLLLLILAGCAHDTTLNRADIHLYGGLAAGRMPAESDSLVCISYNIEYSEELKQALLDLTTDPRLQQPDILLLQEMDAEGAAFLAGRLGLNHFYYPSFIHPHHGRLFLKTSGDAEGIDRVILTGGGSEIPGLIADLTEKTAAPVEAGEPFRRLHNVPPTGDETSRGFTVGIGLALREVVAA